MMGNFDDPFFVQRLILCLCLTVDFFQRSCENIEKSAISYIPQSITYEYSRTYRYPDYAVYRYRFMMVRILVPPAIRLLVFRTSGIIPGISQTSCIIMAAFYLPGMI